MLAVSLHPAIATADGTPASAPSGTLLLGDTYPLEVDVSFHAALFHWLDSLAGLDGPGMTAGKTRTAHREQFVRQFGPPDSKDQLLLQSFAELRLRDVTNRPDDRLALAQAFFETPDLDAALLQAESLLGAEDAETLADVLAHFGERYLGVWQSGEVVQRFLDKTRGSSVRPHLARFLRGVASFYGVEPDQPFPPRLVLVPVISGYGTHAQALGRTLLIEIRPYEKLRDEVAPIVHENVHFLYHRIGAERAARLQAVAAETGPHGEQAWLLMLEALPTAIAQGVAWRRWGPPEWSLDRRWYHIDEVDEYAKRLYPLVNKTLDDGGRFDDAFVRRAVALYPGASAAAPVNRRSP